MGLTREIEQIYQDALELDLERISRGVLASSHWTPKPPVSMFHFYTQDYDPAKKEDLHVSLRAQDYQIVRIELDPLEAHLTSRIEQLRQRRQHRNTPPTEVENAGHIGDAYHAYIHESQAQGPISIVPRSLDVDSCGKVVDPPYVIRVGGVDYVRDDIIRTENGDVYKKLQLNVNSNANVDQWPEEVVLRGNTHSDTDYLYVRFDVGFLEKDTQDNWHKRYIRLRKEAGE